MKPELPPSAGRAATPAPPAPPARATTSATPECPIGSDRRQERVAARHAAETPGTAGPPMSPGPSAAVWLPTARCRPEPPPAAAAAECSPAICLEKLRKKPARRRSISGETCAADRRRSRAEATERRPASTETGPPETPEYKARQAARAGAQSTPDGLRAAPKRTSAQKPLHFCNKPAHTRGRQSPKKSREVSSPADPSISIAHARRTGWRGRAGPIPSPEPR